MNRRHFYSSIEPTQNQGCVTDVFPFTFVGQPALHYAPPEECAASEGAEMTSNGMRAQGRNNPAIT